MPKEVAKLPSGRKWQPVIEYSSDHLCRLKRMWEDVRDEVIQFYMTLFTSYEREGLKIQNVWHIFTLQYMFKNTRRIE